ncbi:hypothetical protein STIAU_5373, partial [Stigmatella aurantiaca DW4/3-1]
MLRESPSLDESRDTGRQVRLAELFGPHRHPCCPAARLNDPAHHQLAAASRLPLLLLAHALHDRGPVREHHFHDVGLRELLTHIPSAPRRRRNVRGGRTLLRLLRLRLLRAKQLVEIVVRGRLGLGARDAGHGLALARTRLARPRRVLAGHGGLGPGCLGGLRSSRLDRRRRRRRRHSHSGRSGCWGRGSRRRRSGRRRCHGRDHRRRRSGGRWRRRWRLHRLRRGGRRCRCHRRRGLWLRRRLEGEEEPNPHDGDGRHRDPRNQTRLASPLRGSGGRRLIPPVPGLRIARRGVRGLWVGRRRLRIRRGCDRRRVRHRRGLRRMLRGRRHHRGRPCNRSRGLGRGQIQQSTHCWLLRHRRRFGRLGQRVVLLLHERSENARGGGFPTRGSRLGAQCGGWRNLCSCALRRRARAERGLHRRGHSGSLARHCRGSDNDRLGRARRER